MKHLLKDKELHGDYWRFIREWLPDYASNELAELHLNISMYLNNGDDITDECKNEIIAHGGNLADKDELNEMRDNAEVLLMRAAMINFLNISCK